MTSAVGFVGLPNVGKSTLWNAITRQNAAASNFPFCTIEPNKASVIVPDSRLKRLADIAGSKVVLPPLIEFVDIAGLIAGASQGKGLGNQFLNDIRHVNAIGHVLRCFPDRKVVHVDRDGEDLDPVGDFAIILNELMLADLQMLEKRRENIAKKKSKNVNYAAQTNVDSSEMLETVDVCGNLLEDGVPVAFENFKVNLNKIRNADEGKVQRLWSFVQSLQLLTSKPALVVANVDEDSVKEGNEFSKKIESHLNSIYEESGMKIPLVVLSASLEDNAAKSESESARMELLELFGLEETGLDKMIEECSRLLDLQCFYTIGPKEARAWKIRRGSQALECAAKIHSDIANGFISADVIKPDVFMEYKGEANVKSAGKLLLKGREYIVEDGDIIHFRFKKPLS